MSIRSTLYLDEGLHRALRMKAATGNKSMSEIVNDALRAALKEDAEDLTAFEERRGEQTIGYEELLRQLRADGTL